MSDETSDNSTDTSLLVHLVDGPVFLLALLTVTSFLGRHWWVFELTCHFRLQYGIGLLVCCLLYLTLKQYSRALITVLLILPHAYGIVPYYNPANASATSDAGVEQELTCLSVNVSVSNPDRTRLKKLVHREQPDLLLLMEVDLDWVRNGTGFNELFKDRKMVPRSEHYGMVLFSTRPFDQARVLRPSHSTVSVLYASIEFRDRDLHVTAVHTPSPIASHLARDRNQVLTGVAKRVKAQPDPRLVMGDLNTTSWSPYFRDFLERTGLRDSRMGRGLQPSWPAVTRIWPLQICIDHLLVSDDVTVLDRRVGPDVGSDHLPIIARLHIAPRPSAGSGEK